MYIAKWESTKWGGVQGSLKLQELLHPAVSACIFERLWMLLMLNTWRVVLVWRALKVFSAYLCASLLCSWACTWSRPPQALMYLEAQSREQSLMYFYELGWSLQFGFRKEFTQEVKLSRLFSCLRLCRWVQAKPRPKKDFHSWTCDKSFFFKERERKEEKTRGRVERRTDQHSLVPAFCRGAWLLGCL